MSTLTRVVLIPGVLALLPEYASVEDPVAELRAAVLEAVGWLGRDVEVLADDQGRRVADWALHAAGAALAARPLERAGYLVVGNGSAKRTTEAPGYFDERAAAFDENLAACLTAGHNAGLGSVDVELAEELWASVAGIVRMRGLPDLGPGETLYAGDPFGVQYWVMRWQCAS